MFFCGSYYKIKKKGGGEGEGRMWKRGRRGGERKGVIESVPDFSVVVFYLCHLPAWHRPIFVIFGAPGKSSLTFELGSLKNAPCSTQPRVTTR